MAAARYIGRVGALAVAMGVGAAVATGHGVASAEPGADGGSDAGASSSSSPGSDSASQPDAGDHEPSSGVEDSSSLTDPSPSGPPSAEDPEADASGPVASPDDEADAGADVITENDGGIDEVDPPEDTSADDDDSPAGDDWLADAVENPIPGEADSAYLESTRQHDSVAAQRAATSSVESDQLATDRRIHAAASAPADLPAASATELATSLKIVSAVADADATSGAAPDATSSTIQRAGPNPIGGLLAIPGSFVKLATNLITAALTPFLAPAAPTAPAQPPLLWAMLAWIRREINHTFFNTRPTLAYDAVHNEQDSLGVVTGDLDPVDSEGDPVKVAIVSGPQNGAVEVNADGTFRYVPNPEFLATGGGTDNFVVSLTDTGFHLHGLLGLFRPGGGHTTTATVSVAVAPVNTPPGGGSTTDVEIDPVSGTVSGRVIATDIDGDGITFSGPATSTKGATVTVEEDGYFTYAPTPDMRHAAAANDSADTTDTFTVTAIDGRGGVTDVSVTVSIDPHNTAPTVLSSVSTEADGSTTITLTVTDEDGDPVRLVVNEPAKGTIPEVPADRTIIIDPADGSTLTLHYIPDSAAEPGTDTVTLSVDDGYLGGQFTTTLTVTIDAPSMPPVITGITTGSTDVTTGAISGTVAASDDDGPVRYTVSTPSHGQVSIDATGRFTYTPDLDYFGSKPAGATDTFSVMVTGADGATATRTLTYKWTSTISGLATTDSIDDLSETKVWGWAISHDGTTLYLNDGTPYFTPAGGIAQDIRVFQIEVDGSGNRTYTQLDSIRVPGIVAANAIALSPDGTRLYVQLADAVDEWSSQQPARVRAIDIATGRLDPAINVALDFRFSDMAVGPNGNQLYGASYWGHPTIIDLTSGDIAVISDDFSFFVAVGSDGNTMYHFRGTDAIVQTDLNTHQTRVISGNYDPDRPLAVSADGTRLYTVGLEGDIVVRDASSGAILQSIQPGTEYVLRLSVASDGTVYATNPEGEIVALTPVRQLTGTITA